MPVPGSTDPAAERSELAVADLVVVGRMPWSSNATFLCELRAPDDRSHDGAGDDDDRDDRDDAGEDEGDGGSRQVQAGDSGRHALATSGLLAPKIGGPSVKPYQPDGIWEAVAMLGSRPFAYRAACVRTFCGPTVTFFASTTPHLVGRDTVYVFSGGMGRLPRAIAEGLAVDCGARVTAVETPEAGPCRVTVARDGAETVQEADLVVCATEGSLAAGLFPGLGEEERRFFGGVRYNALGIVHYRLSRQVAPAMKFFTRAAAGPLATWQQVPGSEATGQAPQLYAQLSPEAVSEAVERGMIERLDELVGERARALYPDLDRDVADLHNQWIARKLPTFYPGYARSVAAFRDRQSAARRRAYFCGDYLAQSLITGAAASTKPTLATNVSSASARTAGRK